METVLGGVTGMFFDEQTPDSLMEAVRRFEASESTFSPERIALHAQRFSKERFKESMAKAIDHFAERHFSGLESGEFSIPV